MNEFVLKAINVIFKLSVSIFYLYKPVFVVSFVLSATTQTGKRPRYIDRQTCSLIPREWAACWHLSIYNGSPSGRQFGKKKNVFFMIYPVLFFICIVFCHSLIENEQCKREAYLNVTSSFWVLLSLSSEITACTVVEMLQTMLAILALNLTADLRPPLLVVLFC